MGTASSGCLSQQILVLHPQSLNPSGCTQKNEEPVFERRSQRRDTSDVDRPPVRQRNVLVDGAGRAQEVADFVEGPAEALSRIEVLEAAHRPIASFYPPVILFDHVVFVQAGAV